MSSEWMKVMLEEIARKKAEEEQARAEAQRRRGEAGHGEAGRGEEGGRGDNLPTSARGSDRAPG